MELKILEFVYEFIKEMNLIETFIQLFMALIFGGILGLERGWKKRPAGFRTYMLVCLGSSLVMMTNKFISDNYGTSDLGRMGAQVISGIGFLGAGTIIVTGRNQVKGLTTAAGLWAAACIGLAIGIGFYGGAIIGEILIILTMTVLHKMEERVMAVSKVMNVYIEFENLSDVSYFIEFLKLRNMKVTDMEIVNNENLSEKCIAAFMTVRFSHKQSHVQMAGLLQCVKGVRSLEEI